MVTVATDTEPGRWLFDEAKVKRQNSAGNPYATQYLEVPLIRELVTKSLEVSGWFFGLSIISESFQVGNLVERCCALLALRQESYRQTATELSGLDSFQAAFRAGAFGPEPEKRLEEQHRFIESMPIPHVLLEHRSGRQGQIPVSVPVPAPARSEEPMIELMNVLPLVEKPQAARAPTSTEGASGLATSLEGVSGRFTPTLSDAGSTFGVGLEARAPLHHLSLNRLPVLLFSGGESN